MQAIRSEKDLRIKRVALTEQGQKVSEHARREIWPVVTRAVAEICNGLEGPILEQLTQIEEALVRQPLDQRARPEESK